MALTKKDILHTLEALANTPAYKGGSLGYIPQILFVKWVCDNSQTEGFLEKTGIKFPEGFSWKVILDDIEEDKIFSVVREIKEFYRLNFMKPVMLCVLDSEGDKDHTPFTRQLVNVSSFDTVVKQTIRSLDLISLSASNFEEKTTLSDAFEEYIKEMDEENYPFPLFTSAVEKTVNGLIKNTEAVYDPFCRFGGILKRLNAGKLIGSDTSEYIALIAYIRLKFLGINADISPFNVFEKPNTTPDGKLARYPAVVTNLVRYFTQDNSTFVKLDIYGRFSKYCLNDANVSHKTALSQALASTQFNGKCIVIDDGRLFSGISERFRISENSILILDDILEAVIKVSEPKQDSLRRIPNPTVIYVFNKCKSDERKDKILFINADNNLHDDITAPKILECYFGYKEIAGYSKIVENTEVIKNKVNMTVANYTAVLERPKNIDVGKALREFSRLEERRKSSVEEMRIILESLRK